MGVLAVPPTLSGEADVVPILSVCLLVTQMDSAWVVELRKLRSAKPCKK